MYCVNFDKLKIEKMYNYHTKEITNIAFDADKPLTELKKCAEETVTLLLADCPATETNFVINLDCANPVEPEDFVCFVNILVSEFFNQFCDFTKGRPRERRLDVPEQLKCVNASMAQLKRAINQMTKLDKFNLEIVCDDLFYYLVDRKDDEDE